MKKAEDKPTVEVSVELAAAAQMAYAENAKREAQQQGHPTNLGLQSGWGGKGR